MSEVLSAETIEACGRRIGSLRAGLESTGVDGLLVAAPTDIQYLTGFHGDDSVLLVDGDGVSIISDSRYGEFLEPWEHAPGVAIVMGIRHRLEDAVADLCRQRSIGRLGIQAERTTVTGRRRLVETLSGIGIVDTEHLVPVLRRTKDALEIAAIERAAGIQEAALTAALEHLRVGMTELEFAARIEFEMKSRGATGASFAPIVATGPNSSVIHHSTGATPIAPGTLLVDWGAAADGYCSDLTRTFAFGTMPDAIRAVYPIVLEAQQAAIQACAPGRTCAEIDAVARGIITDAGHGEHFGHGLGHGLGIEVHESPYFNDLETDTLLEPGMVMTVEPGIYLPGIGGVRIEDDVLITPDGARVLSHWPRDLESASLEAAGPVGVGP
jgi:Xaa-Pro aminopeptidase